MPTHLPKTQSPQLRNSYYALRHGRSQANEAGIIVSDPANGVEAYGLSAGGRELARRKFDQLAPEWSPFLGKTFIYTSDFLRARQTANLFAEVLELPEPQATPLLRERGFGELEGQSHERYAEVWAEDRKSATHRAFGCESTSAVAARLNTLLADLEAAHSGMRVVLVAHGDVLQILQTIFAGLASNHHRDLPHLETAELRLLGGETANSG